MKDINEYTAEVFRRSEKRIKEQKRSRDRVLAMCMIFAVCSVMFLPTMISSIRTKDDKIECDTSNEAYRGCPYISVEVMQIDPSAENREMVTDIATVSKIYDTINSLFADDLFYGAVQENSPGEELRLPEDIPQNDGSLGPSGGSTYKRGYTIIFKSEDGSQIEYELVGNELLNVKTSKKVVLGKAQVTELITALGISDK